MCQTTKWQSKIIFANSGVYLVQDPQVMTDPSYYPTQQHEIIPKINNMCDLLQ